MDAHFALYPPSRPNRIELPKTCPLGPTRAPDSTCVLATFILYIVRHIPSLRLNGSWHSSVSVLTLCYVAHVQTYKCGVAAMDRVRPPNPRARLSVLSVHFLSINIIQLRFAWARTTCLNFERMRASNVSHVEGFRVCAYSGRILGVAYACEPFWFLGVKAVCVVFR